MVDRKDILISESVVSEPDRVRTILSRRVRDLLSSRPRGDEDLHIVRFVLRIPSSNPFAWLRAQNQLPKVYWQGRGDDVVTAAVGTADRCFGGADADYDALRSQLDAVLPRSDVRVRYFGGFRFDRSREPADEWASFGTFTFTLPRFEYLLNRDRGLLACNLILPRDREKCDEILEAIGKLQFVRAEQTERIPTPISRRDHPGESEWRRQVDWALDAFRSEEMEKVVLARRARFGFAEPLDPILLLQELEAATANCFAFGFQFEEGCAFVGATPERLFRREGRQIQTEAVAGTRPRGTSPEEDTRRLQSLMASEKDQREHDYVRVSIRDALRPLCTDLRIDPEASSMQLPRNWHLVSRCQGTIHEDVHGSDVMRALHPTPAVGGYPTEPALEAIRALEPFDRGWYAGPVGWIGSHAAEFAVALRCGLVRNDSLSLYSGAGIVTGSDPGAEWAEIEQKISDFIKVLGLEHRGE